MLARNDREKKEETRCTYYSSRQCLLHGRLGHFFDPSLSTCHWAEAFPQGHQLHRAERAACLRRLWRRWCWSMNLYLLARWLHASCNQHTTTRRCANPGRKDHFKELHTTQAEQNKPFPTVVQQVSQVSARCSLVALSLLPFYGMFLQSSST